MNVVIMCKYTQKIRKGKGFETFFEKNAVYLQADYENLKHCDTMKDKG